MSPSAHNPDVGESGQLPRLRFAAQLQPHRLRSIHLHSARVLEITVKPHARALHHHPNWSNNVYNLVTKGPQNEFLGPPWSGSKSGPDHEVPGGLMTGESTPSAGVLWWRSPAKTRITGAKRAPGAEHVEQHRPSRWPAAAPHRGLGAGHTQAYGSVQREMRCATGGYGQPHDVYPYVDIREDRRHHNTRPPCPRQREPAVLT